MPGKVTQVQPIPIARGEGSGIFSRVNPMAILIGMGIAGVFTWFFTGGGGNGNSRRPTHMPQFGLGDDVGGQTITGIRTRWEYQMNDQSAWTPEELL